MRSLSISLLGSVALACALFTACENSEEDVVPQMNKAKPAKVETAPAPAPKEEEPELVPIQSLSAKNDNSKQEVAPAATAAQPASGEAIQPLDEGQYVIQVSIQPSKKAADGIVKKLAEQKIEAYVAEVENPGELEGTYYRVRIGYFSSIKMAQDYGKQVLASLNFAWWIDNSSNDEVGNPTNEGSSDYSNSTETGYTEQYSAPEETAEETVTETQSAEPVQEAAPAEPVQEAPVAESVPEEAPVEQAPVQEEVQPAEPVQEVPTAEPAAEAPAAPEAPAAEVVDDWE